MKEEFSGNLKELILYMMQNEADCCEVTNTVEDVSVTVEVTIKKVVAGDEVIYDADEFDDYGDEIDDYERSEYLS